MLYIVVFVCFVLLVIACTAIICKAFYYIWSRTLGKKIGEKRAREEEKRRGPSPSNYGYWNTFSPEDKKVFEVKRDQGFEHFAHLTGWGPWKNDDRLMDVWAFSHPAGNVFAWAFVKSGNHHNRVLQGWLEFPTAEKFDAFLRSWKVMLGEKEKISDTLEKFGEPENETINSH